MGTSTFQKGTRVEIEGRPSTLLRQLADGTWLIEDDRSGHIAEHAHEALLALYQQGKLRFGGNGNRPKLDPRLGRPPELASEAALRLAKHRRLYVKAALEAPTQATLLAAIERTWKESAERAKQQRAAGVEPAEILAFDRAPHCSTVRRWVGRYRDAGGDVLALVRNDGARGNRSQRVNDESVKFIEQAIESVYLQPTRGSITATVERAAALINRENALRNAADRLPAPSRRHVRRLIAAIPAFDRAVAREGRDAAEKRFRGALQHRVTRAPLERVEVDHSPFDVMIIDDASGLPLGRPYLTLCVDDYTRCVLGLYVSFEPPSFFTVARCLKHAMLPKTDLREKYPSIVNPWAAHGVMRELVMDNGAEFHSESLETACLSLGIEMHYSPRRQPWFKAKVERVIGTVVRGATHGLPGTTFSNIFDKGDYSPVKHAVVRYSTFKEIIHKWVVDVYHQRVHRTLGASPAEAWAAGARNSDVPVPDNPERFDLILRHAETRELTHRGIELYGLTYNAADLIALRRRLGERLTVQVRVDRADLGHIHVITPDGKQALKVPALRRDYAAGLSEWQHRVITRYARTRLDRHDPAGWLEAKLQIAEIIDAEVLEKRRKRRPTASKAIGRYRNFDAVPPPPASAMTVIPPPTLAGRPQLSVVRPAGPEPASDASSGNPFAGAVPVKANTATPSSALVQPLIAAPPPAAPTAPRERRLKPLVRPRGPRLDERPPGADMEAPHG